jgi:hypothetical protein
MMDWRYLDPEVVKAIVAILAISGDASMSKSMFEVLGEATVALLKVSGTVNVALLELSDITVDAFFI